MTHLTEEERHGIADGSLDASRLAAAEAHLHGCAECAADVDRIRTLMKRTNESRGAGPADVEELWPAIRARIEERKVVTMPGREGVSAGVRQGRRWIWTVGGIAAAAVMALWLTRGRVAPVDSTNVAQVTDSGVSLIALVDSTHAYQEEAQTLLNRLELQRATLRPEFARAIDRDLRTIDVAIAELQDAIRNDPNNPALRRLLASSYRQKVDLLKRAGNAG
jgi:anti-sigma factor RsiW